MNEKDIINFKNFINDFSIDALNNLRAQLQEKMSQMIMESDVIMKIAIVESKLKEKLDKEQENGTINNSSN